MSTASGRLGARSGGLSLAGTRCARQRFGHAVGAVTVVGCLLLSPPAGAQGVPIPLSPGVANVGQSYGVAQATRSGHLVALSGVVRPAQGILGTLPPGLRPQAREIFMVITGRHTPARVDVTPDGRIQVVAGGSNDSISLSGIVFALP